jgi:hypothetical protein
VSAAIAGAACGGAPARPASTPAPATDGAAAEAAKQHAFDEGEARALDELAASDPRFAARTGTAAGDAARSAAVNAHFAEDPDAMVHEGSLDLFSFAARARGLDRAESIAKRLAPPQASYGEGQRLTHLLDEERARLAEERDLPRGASELVRGMVDTWGPPATPEVATKRDAWAAQRLDELRASLGGSKLPYTELVELDDALDPLERLASPGEYPATAGALARFRVALGTIAPPPRPSREEAWAHLERGLRTHLGVTGDAKAVRARLENAAAALRKRIDAQMTRAQRADSRALAAEADQGVLAPGRCDPVAGSRVRSLAPPPERTAICGALRLLEHTKGGDAELLALVTLDLDVTVALWALAIHADGADPSRAEVQVRPVIPVAPEREGRLVRAAAGRPLVAIGAGLAADLLTRASDGDPASIARRWLALGDAPLDVVEGELWVTPAPP